MKKNEIVVNLRQQKTRSAWSKGVMAYSLDMLEWINDDVQLNANNAKKILLNGSSNWSEYSQSGNALVYDEDIVLRLCTLSEYKKTKGGHRMPNSNENWLDVQTRALRQAYRLIERILKEEKIK